MKNTIDIQRRRLLKYAGITAAVASSYPALLFATDFGVKNQPSPGFKADVEIELKLEPTSIPIFDGQRTNIWKIYGKILKGAENALENLPDTYLGPTIHLHKGDKVRIYLRNNLPEESILHWHGLHVPADVDGNPVYAINYGETYVYEFEVLNRAGTYWYHAHPHHITGEQVYFGLAGLFIVSDDEEKALGLPEGRYDIPLVIQDRRFDSQNQLVYVTHMMQRMHGFLGDRIFVNGQPDFVLPVETRSYRLRLLNGSNSRIYKLAWDDASPFTVIGVDGGLLESPEHYPYLMLGPGERRELWIDFSDRKVGSELTLRSIPFADFGHGMMGGMGGGGMRGGGGHQGGMRGGDMREGGGQQGGMRGGGMREGGGQQGGRRGGMHGMMSEGELPMGGDYPLFKVKVVKQSQNRDRLPDRLTTIKKLQYKDAANADNPNRITLSMRHMAALLNGRSYQMNDVRADEIIPVNTLQVIQFDNGFHGGMHGMMAMPHPMHLHGEQFQIVKREVNPRSGNDYESVSAGFVDSGWKDVVLVMPGEKVTLLKPFNDFKGLFMYHCHNLEHEDLGMMRDFLIK